ncbi:hypothetical protein ACFL6B_05280 [Thermodesulfobacteriota bacterium]
MLDNNIKEIFNNIVPIAEVSNYIPVKEKTLRNWRSKGIYPHIFVKLGGKVFVNMNEFSKIIGRQTDNAIQEAKQLGRYE